MILYGYKRCSTCREAQRALQQQGIKAQFHDMVEQPPSEETIRTWMKMSGRPAEEFVNTRGTVYRARHLKSARFTDDEWVRELSKDGKLVKRPVLVTDRDVYVGFHEGAYRRIALDGSEQ